VARGGRCGGSFAPTRENRPGEAQATKVSIAASEVVVEEGTIGDFSYVIANGFGLGLDWR
jgi:hypothetical protein